MRSTSKRNSVSVLFFVLLALASVSLQASSPAIASPQEQLDVDTILRIRDEGLNRSQVMDHLSWLADVYGPRLTGSPQIEQAKEWTIARFEEWGLENIHEERFPFGKGWEVVRFHAHMVEPQVMPIIGYPRSWSPSTDGTVLSEVAYVSLETEDDLARYRGQLEGKIVLMQPIRQVDMLEGDLVLRMTEELKEEARRTPVSAGGDTGGRGGSAAVRRPWFGAKLQPITPDIAETLNLKRPAGALVASVTAKSPAARAGLRPGDLITAIDNQPVDDPNAFDYRFATKPLGGRAMLTVERQGKASNLAVALETAPETPREELLLESRSPFAGARVVNLSPAVAEELRIDSEAEGVVIIGVESGSSANVLGFRPGDIVLAVNGEKVSRTRDLERIAGRTSRQWNITILRGGQQLNVTLRG